MSRTFRLGSDHSSAYWSPDYDYDASRSEREREARREYRAELEEEPTKDSEAQ